VAPGPGEVARYAAARARRLPLERDTSAALGGQDPVWEVASNILSRAFARGWRVARVGALDSIARELLAPERPSVIDGRMHPAAWYSGPVKTKADEGAYSNRNLACCDAAYDAAAAVALGDLDPEQVKGEYARVSGHAIDEERWLTYQLVVAWAARRDGLFDEAGERRASTRALRHYFARRFLRDVPRGAGGFCALDVDGVLETETLGFPALSPAGALALRALRAHGHRPLLASGRSAGEIRDRCIDYGLAGGVAEYGAAVFHAARDEVEALVTPAGAAALERARAVLAGRAGVELGSEHVHTIRAWRRDDHGRPGPLREDDMRAALEAAGEGMLRTVPGESQTDIVPAEVDKARGLRALTERLGAAGAPIELAVGDAVEDLPMLALGRIAMAPANADAAVRAGHIRIARRGHQAGLAVAVAELVGHAPGACPACAPPPADRRAELVLGILAAREGGRARLAAQALRTTWLARGRRAAR
jgi:hydroxymethylpyrimidine pyrophosphatase-like HAD family hydrolase